MPHILSITNSKGRIVSLLNDDCSEKKKKCANKRKYHCTEPNCNKSFTTSGHLARHNRIHTGEKNFHCLYPGCPSKFSRQDNMMQHYKTHMSSRSRLHYYYHYHHPTAAFLYQKQQHEPSYAFKREWSPTSSQSSCSTSGSSSPTHSPVQPQGYYYHQTNNKQSTNWHHISPSSYCFENYL